MTENSSTFNGKYYLATLLKAQEIKDKETYIKAHDNAVIKRQRMWKDMEEISPDSTTLTIWVPSETQHPDGNGNIQKNRKHSSHTNLNMCPSGYKNNLNPPDQDCGDYMVNRRQYSFCLWLFYSIWFLKPTSSVWRQYKERGESKNFW